MCVRHVGAARSYKGGCAQPIPEAGFVTGWLMSAPRRVGWAPERYRFTSPFRLTLGRFTVERSLKG